MHLLNIRTLSLCLLTISCSTMIQAMSSDAVPLAHYLNNEVQIEITVNKEGNAEYRPVKTRWSLLHKAAIHGNVNEINQFLDSGLPVNKLDAYGATALYYGAINGHVDAVRTLLARQADPRITMPAAPSGAGYFGPLDRTTQKTALEWVKARIAEITELNKEHRSLRVTTDEDKKYKKQLRTIAHLLEQATANQPAQQPAETTESVLSDGQSLNGLLYRDEREESVQSIPGNPTIVDDHYGQDEPEFSVQSTPGSLSITENKFPAVTEAEEAQTADAEFESIEKPNPDDVLTETTDGEFETL